jgi:hypothetical protein
MLHLNDKNARSADLHSARARLLDDDRVLKRKVRCVAAAGDTDPNALALYTLAAGHRFRWTPEDWAAVLNKLDDCELTVKEWLRVTGES